VKQSASGSLWPLPEERARKRELKRDAVLATAARLFNRSGFHATSLDDVAKALGVTKPTIYHYFSNKDEILFECTRRGLAAISAGATKASLAGGDCLERLRSLMTEYATVMTQDFGRCITLTSETDLSEASKAEFRRIKREVDRMVRAVVSEGMQDGSIAPGDPKLVTFAVTGALNWIARWFDESGPMSVEEVSTALVDTLVRGLAPREPAKR
jgi:AcrR family transcriptional regulator